MRTTRIIRRLDSRRFHDFLKESADKITFDSHVLDHLILFQRGLHSIEALLALILREIPSGVGLQQNGRIALFYRRKEGFIRVIIFLSNNCIRIETFFWSCSMPNMQRL